MVSRWIAVLMLLLVAPWGAVAQAEQAAAAVSAVEQGLLWKVEKRGVEPSYLFGTMHSEHIDVVTLPAAVREAFMASDRVVLEMLMDTATVATLGSAMQISSGPDLSERIDASLYRQVVQAMSEQGMPEHAVRIMKPWAVATTLMVPPSTTGLFLDRVLYLEALAKGKPITGLESAAEQIAVFDGMSEADQVTLLREAVKAYPNLEQIYAEMRAAYVRRDLQGLVRISDATLQDVDPAFVERFNTRLVSERNQRMLERVKTDMERGGAFVAIGALHLAGDDGLVQLLRGRGYKVTAAY